MRIMIFSALDEEVEYLRQEKSGHKNTVHQLFSWESIGNDIQKSSFNDVEVFLVSPRDAGLVSTAVCATSAISQIRPDFSIMVGICGGRKSEGIELTDIIVPTSSFLYSYGAFKTDKIEPEIRSENIDRQIIGWIKNTLSPDVLKKFHEDFPDVSDKPRVVPRLFGDSPMGCGDFVVKDTKILDDASQMDRKLIGVDMESYSFLRSIILTTKKSNRMAVLKAVSDFADSEKNDSRREFCKYIIANSVVSLLKNLSEAPFNTIEDGVSEKTQNDKMEHTHEALTDEVQKENDLKANKMSLSESIDKFEKQKIKYLIDNCDELLQYCSEKGGDPQEGGNCINQTDVVCLISELLRNTQAIKETLSFYHHNSEAAHLAERLDYLLTIETDFSAIKNEVKKLRQTIKRLYRFLSKLTRDYDDDNWSDDPEKRIESFIAWRYEEFVNDDDDDLETLISSFSTINTTLQELDENLGEKEYLRALKTNIFQDAVTYYIENIRHVLRILKFLAKDRLEKTRSAIKETLNNSTSTDICAQLRPCIDGLPHNLGTVPNIWQEV